MSHPDRDIPHLHGTEDTGFHTLSVHTDFLPGQYTRTKCEKRIIVYKRHANKRIFIKNLNLLFFIQIFIHTFAPNTQSNRTDTLRAIEKDKPNTELS